jgi:hypothetical protein
MFSFAQSLFYLVPISFHPRRFHPAWSASPSPFFIGLPHGQKKIAVSR